MAAVLLAAGAVVVAADKMAQSLRKEITGIEGELRKRLTDKPPDFHTLCRLEIARYKDRDEQCDELMQHLQSLYLLQEGLREGIKKLNPYWQPPEEVDDDMIEYEYVHREYDVSDIISQAPDHPAPDIALGRGPFLKGSTTKKAVKDKEEELAFGDDEAVVGAGIDWEKIEELICRILPDQEADHEIKYVSGRLVCRITRAQAKAIEELLKRLRESMNLAVTMEVRFLRTSAAYLSKLAGEKDGQAIYLSAQVEKKLAADLKLKKEVELVASSEVTATDGQVVHIREGRQVSMLMDYDVTAAGVASLQPVVKLINEGLICQFRPAAVRGGREVSVDVLASLSMLRKDIRKGDFLGGEIMFPIMDTSVIRTAVRVPSGKAVLVGGTTLNSGTADKTAPEYIVYLKPTAESRKK